MKHKGPRVIREPNLGALGRTRPRERGTVARLAAKRWKLEQGQVCKESPWAFCGLSIFSPVGVTVGFLWVVYVLPGWSPRGLSVGCLCSSVEQTHVGKSGPGRAHSLRVFNVGKHRSRGNHCGSAAGLGQSSVSQAIQPMPLLLGHQPLVMSFLSRAQCLAAP